MSGQWVEGSWLSRAICYEKKNVVQPVNILNGHFIIKWSYIIGKNGILADNLYLFCINYRSNITCTVTNVKIYYVNVAMCYFHPPLVHPAVLVCGRSVVFVSLVARRINQLLMTRLEYYGHFSFLVRFSYIIRFLDTRHAHARQESRQSTDYALRNVRRAFVCQRQRLVRHHHLLVVL
jgi:hypothetical protein